MPAGQRAAYFAPPVGQGMPMIAPGVFNAPVADSSGTTDIALTGYCGDQDCGKKSECQCKGECHCPRYHIRAFGDYLYLRARDAEVPFATQVNSQLGANPAIQTSPLAILDPDYSSGYRAGIGICLSDLSELEVSYSAWETDTHNEIVRDATVPGQAIHSLLIHPGTRNVLTDTVAGAARMDMDYDLIDADFRKIFYRDCTTDLTYLIGLRYGEFRQNLQAVITDDLASATPDSLVFSDIGFYGGGLRLGLEAEHYATRLPMLFYMKGISSLLVGDMRSTYRQTVQANSNYGVNTAWKAGRIVPTFDLELGGGFYLPKGTIRVTAGYMFSAWTNMLKHEDWIDAVQANNFTDMSGVITLDGLVFRLEGRF